MEACEISRKRVFRKSKSVMDGRTDENEKRSESKKENDPRIKRIKESKD